MRWLVTDLRAQFMLVAGIVLLTGMLVVGFWVTKEIEDGVADNAGAVTALYVDAIVAPVVQRLAETGTLDAAARDELQEVVTRGALREEVTAFKLWAPSGRIVFSGKPELVGREFEISRGLADALSGNVDAALTWRSHSENELQAGQSTPLLEVYSPVRSATTGEIIAVAEFYTTAEKLLDRLFDARFRSWLVVGTVGLGIFAALYVVVARGSRTIATQRAALDEKIAELSELLEGNRGLAQRVEQANHRIADLHERVLRRVSAELHDGPTQLLAFAALRLDDPKTEKQKQVQQAIDEAMRELRYICQGMALPDIEAWTTATIARRVVSVHERRTACKVSLSLGESLPELSLAGKTCIYRFLQETLNNGARHAPGAQQGVSITREGEHVVVEVRDDGPGFEPHHPSDGLGLPGLRERVIGLKGGFELHSQNGGGTRIVMRLPAQMEADPR